MPSGNGWLVEGQKELMFSVIHDPSVSKICHIEHHYTVLGSEWLATLAPAPAQPEVF